MAGLGDQGIALLNAAMRANGNMNGGMPQGGQPAGQPQPGLLQSFFDPNNFGGKFGLLAKMRGMTPTAPPAAAGAPLSLAPGGMNMTPQVSPTALTGMY